MLVIDGLTIDVEITSEGRLESLVTEFPVESGSDIADHVHLRPNSVTVEGLVSDSPIEPISRAAGTKPSDDVYQFLVRLRDNREPVVVTTSLTSYSDMILETLTVPRTAATGEALIFTGVFKQIRFVNNERSFLLVAVPRAKRKTNRGWKPPTIPQFTPVKTKANSSKLFKIVQGDDTSTFLPGL